MVSITQKDMFWLRLTLYALTSIGVWAMFAYNVHEGRFTRQEKHIDRLEKRIRDLEMIKMKGKSGGLYIPAEIGECVLIRGWREGYADDEIEDEQPINLDQDNLELVSVSTRDVELHGEGQVEVIHVYVPKSELPKGERTSRCSKGVMGGPPPGCDPPMVGCEFLGQSPSGFSCKWFCDPWYTFTLCPHPDPVENLA